MNNLLLHRSAYRRTFPNTLIFRKSRLSCEIIRALTQSEGDTIHFLNRKIFIIGNFLRARILMSIQINASAFFKTYTQTDGWEGNDVGLCI